MFVKYMYLYPRGVKLKTAMHLHYLINSSEQTISSHVKRGLTFVTWKSTVIIYVVEVYQV
jgi:hypothetical protein